MTGARKVTFESGGSGGQNPGGSDHRGLVFHWR